MLDFRQSTAATVVVGPILDSAGAEYASAVIGDLSISKNGGTLTALAAAATLTLIANGQYTLVLTTGNMDTLGRFQITCNKSTYQMPERSGMVMPASVWDALYANATNATGGFATATGSITTLAGAISTFAGGAVSSVSGAVGSISGITFPTNFASLGINASGHVSRVTLVDTTTTNTDMRGTDSAALAATALSTAVWSSTIAGRIDVAVSSRLAPTTANRTLLVAADGSVAAVLDSATQTQIDNVENASGYMLAILAGACADPQTASETYAITVFGSTFTVDMAGQTSTGTRTAPTLTKT